MHYLWLEYCIILKYATLKPEKMTQIIVKTDEVSAQRIETIAERNGNNIFDALAKNLLIEKLAQRLENGIAHFAYRKVNGEIREAYGTRFGRLVKKHIKGTGRSNYGTFSYFDVERGEFRSFRLENILAVE